MHQRRPLANSTPLVVFEQVDQAFILNPVLAVPGYAVLNGLLSHARRHGSGRASVPGRRYGSGQVLVRPQRRWWPESLAPIHDHGADAAGAQVRADRGADKRDRDVLDGRTTGNASEQFLAEGLDIRA